MFVPMLHSTVDPYAREFTYEDAVTAVLANKHIRGALTEHLSAICVSSVAMHSAMVRKVARMVFHATAAALAHSSLGIEAATLVRGICTPAVWETLADAAVPYCAVPLICLREMGLDDGVSMPSEECCARLVQGPAGHALLSDAHREARLPLDWRWTWVGWRWVQLRREMAAGGGGSIAGGTGLRAPEDVPGAVLEDCVLSSKEEVRGADFVLRGLLIRDLIDLQPAAAPAALMWLLKQPTDDAEGSAIFRASGTGAAVCRAVVRHHSDAESNRELLEDVFAVHRLQLFGGDAAEDGGAALLEWLEGIATGHAWTRKAVINCLLCLSEPMLLKVMWSVFLRADLPMDARMVTFESLKYAETRFTAMTEESRRRFVRCSAILLRARPSFF